MPGEIVGRLQSTLDTLLDRSIAAIIGGQNGILEASGVVKGNVELAVLALLGNGDSRANGSDVRVEDEGDNVPVVRNCGADGALGATCASVTNALDLDLGYISIVIFLKQNFWTYGASWWAVTKLNIGKSWCRSSEGEESKNPLHVGLVVTVDRNFTY